MKTNRITATIIPASAAVSSPLLLLFEPPPRFKVKVGDEAGKVVGDTLGKSSTIGEDVGTGKPVGDTLGANSTVGVDEGAAVVGKKLGCAGREGIIVGLIVGAAIGAEVGRAKIVGVMEGPDVGTMTGA